MQRFSWYQSLIVGGVVQVVTAQMFYGPLVESWREPISILKFFSVMLCGSLTGVVVWKGIQWIKRRWSPKDANIVLAGVGLGLLSGPLLGFLVVFIMEQLILATNFPLPEDSVRAQGRAIITVLFSAFWSAVPVGFVIGITQRADVKSKPSPSKKKSAKNAKKKRRTS